MALIREIGASSYERVSFVPIQNIICRCTPNVIRFLMLIGVGNRVECACGRLFHIETMGDDGQPVIVVEVQDRIMGASTDVKLS